MRATVLFSFLLVVLAACGTVKPPRPTGKTTIACSPVVAGGPAFTAEFLPGITADSVDNLQLTFAAAPAAGQTEATLRSCVEAMRSTVRIDHETIVTAWVGDEGLLSLSDGSRHLTFDPQTGTVKTWNERNGMSPTTAGQGQ